MAPTSSCGTAIIAIPAVMKSPSPPPPMNAASTAPEMTWIAAVRRPAKMTGNASGHSIFARIPRVVIPMPRAASTTSGSMPRMPTSVLSMIGGSASSESANRLGRKPVPSSGITSASTASDGSVRPTFATLIAANAARGRCAA